MRVRKKTLAIAIAVILVVSIGVVDFAAGENFIFLTTKQSNVPADATSILFTVRNYSLRIFSWGNLEDYHYERFINGKWETVEPSRKLYDDLGLRTVLPLSSRTEYYPLNDYADFSGKGLYRFVLTVYAGEDGNGEKHNLYCKFAVK